MTAETPTLPELPEWRRGYLVAVSGILGPVLGAALADLDPAPRPPSSILRLRAPAAWTAGDVAAVLQAQGLEVLTLRQETGPSSGAGGPAPSGGAPSSRRRAR